MSRCPVGIRRHSGASGIGQLKQLCGPAESRSIAIGSPKRSHAGRQRRAGKRYVGVVNRDRVVCAVVFTRADRGSQWLGSRVISAQKANTANAFSRPRGVIGFAGALSTANLFAAVQPGGSLFGLQHSNPVDAEAAYQGNAANFGQPNDPLVGEKVGGVNVFGGGLALYNTSGDFVGGLGVSGDTSCADHIIAWKVRHGLNLDNVPAGVSATGDDNIIFPPAAALQSAFTHPDCAPVGAPKPIAEGLPKTHPVGPNP
jgi:uncharacterized protein GlcG (DUF336 family)